MNRLQLAIVLGVCAAGLPAQDAPGGMPAPTQAPNPIPGTREHSKLPGWHDKKDKKKIDEDIVKFSGMVQEMAMDHLVIVTGDHRAVTLHLTKETQFLDGETAIALKDIALGQSLDVDAHEDNEEEFYAVRVHLKAEPTTVVQTPTADADEDARPRLKYGKPATTTARADAPDKDAEDRPVIKRGRPEPPGSAETESAPPGVQEAANIPPDSERAEGPPPVRSKEQEHAEFLEKARDLAFNFTDGLPNYMCQELVTRYFSENHAGTLWKPQDVVSEDVIWNNRQEEYRNVQIDGKKVNPEKVGDRAWSTGEFGSLLADIMQPATQTHFRFVRVATLRHTDAVMFDFNVDQPNSHWTVKEGGQSIRPAYSGTIWFEKTSGRALRVEYSADDVPKTFPADTVETSLDYDNVQLGQRKFLLPVHSEVLMCHRGTPICSKNVIEFRNYHKYGAESDIKFADEQNAPPLAPSSQTRPKR